MGAVTTGTPPARPAQDIVVTRAGNGGIYRACITCRHWCPAPGTSLAHRCGVRGGRAGAREWCERWEEVRT